PFRCGRRRGARRGRLHARRHPAVWHQRGHATEHGGKGTRRDQVRLPPRPRRAARTGRRGPSRPQPMSTWTDPHAGEPADLVRIAGLGVDYGDRRALDEVHLRVPPGEVFGLLGPNGAGKTTMFRVMATLLPP